MSIFDQKKEYEETNVKETVEVEETVVESSDHSNEVAVITENTKIEGNITTEGHLVLAGSIKGNITTEGNLVLSGTTNGDVSCKSAIINGANCGSNLSVAENIIVNENTVIRGNINCINCTVCGKVIGDITASGSVFLKKTANVKGNVKAAHVGMEIGAKVSGKIDCE